MKILYVLEYYYPHVGGVEILFQKLAEEAAKKKNLVRVITMKLPNSLANEHYNGVEIKRLWVPNIGSRYWFTILAFFKLLFFANKFDIIHTTTYNAALPAWLIAKIFRKKIIITIHEVWGRMWMQIPDMSYISKMIHRLYEFIVVNIPYDKIVTDSFFTKKIIKKDNVQTIHCGVDNELFSREKNEGKSLEVKKKLCLRQSYVALYFGRPGWAKGLEYFINAIPQIKSQIPNFKTVLLISRDPIVKYNSIVENINTLQIQKDVLLLDPVPRGDVPSYLMIADCVVVPSISEGFGFNVAEASALEIPIVATNAGSIPEVISGKNILVKPQNSDELALGVINMYKNRQVSFWDKKKFSWEKAVNDYLKAYQSL
ncbi:MAG: glycosyltransferase family 4 protein [Candidatus Kerfeldbacteria bacterium]